MEEPDGTDGDELGGGSRWPHPHPVDSVRRHGTLAGAVWYDRTHAAVAEPGRGAQPPL